MPRSRACGKGRSPFVPQGVSSTRPSLPRPKPNRNRAQTESFAATGWRVGWLIGPESIIKPTLAVSTRIIFCSNSPLQEAAAAGLERAKEHDFFATQTREYAERRDVLVKAFDNLGMKYTLPQGTYFILLVCRSVVPIVLCRSFSSPRPFGTHRIYPILKYPMTSHSPRRSMEEVETSSAYFSA